MKYNRNFLFTLSIVVIIILIIHFSLYGVVLSRSNVTADKSYRGMIEVGKTYITNNNMFVVYIKDRYEMYAITPEGLHKSFSRHYSAPISFNNYVQNKNTGEYTITTGKLYSFETDVVYMLPKNLKIQCCELQIMKRWSIWGWVREELLAFGSIRVGEKYISVELRDLLHIISRNKETGASTYRVNTDFMKIYTEKYN